MQIGHDVSIKSLSRSCDPDTPTVWYVQDAKGAIWKVDLVVSHAVSVFVCHHSLGIVYYCYIP